MRSRFVLPLILAMLGTSAARAQPTKEPAGLFPEKVLAYAELRQISLLATEIGALFQGSALEDVPDSLNKLQSKYKLDVPGRMRSSSLGAGLMGLVISPEVRAELGRLQGAAIALTGINQKTGDPEFLAVVQPGQSNAPAFLMRSMMSMAPMQKVETVEGVTLYGLESFRDVMKPMKPGDPKNVGPIYERKVTVGPIFAMTPGALLVGTHDNVKQAVLRLKGKGKAAAKEPSLAQNPAFAQARSAADNTPGMFVYGDPAHLLPLLDDRPLAGDEKRMLSAAIKMINPAAVRAVAQSVALEKGKLSLRKVVLLDPKQKSPLLDLLPTRPLDLDLLNFAPKDAVFVAAIDNGNGEKRFENLVDLLDPLTPRDFKFSDSVMQFEKALGFSIGKDVVGQISAIGFAMGDPFQVKIKVTERTGDNFTSVSSVTELPPMAIIVKAVNEQAAEKLLELLPKVRFAAGVAVEPIKKEIDGREVYILKLGKGEDGEAFCYGRQGSTLVICPQAGTVAMCLNAGAKKQGFLSQPQIARRTVDVIGRQAVVFVKPASMLASLGGLVITSKPDAAKGFSDKRVGDKKNDAKDPPKKPVVKVTYKSPLDDPTMKQMSEILKEEEFLALGLQVTKEKLQIDGSVAGLQKLVPQLIDLAVEAMYRDEAHRIEQMENRKKSGEGAGSGPK